METPGEARLPSTRPLAPAISPGAVRGRADYLPKNWHLYSAVVSMLAGGLTQVVHHPLFTLKTFIQTPNFLWKDFLGRTVRSPIGFLYRGVVSRSLGVMPERVLKMQSWIMTTRFLTDLRGEQSLGIWILGGLAAGMGTAVVSSPSELFMVRAQVHGHRFRDVWRTTGYMNTTQGSDSRGHKYTSLGCFKYPFQDPAIMYLERTDPRLQDNQKWRTDAIEKCYQVALSRGFTAFALQFGGTCTGSAYGPQVYTKRGPPGPRFSCGAEGKGGIFASEVYQITRKTPVNHLDINECATNPCQHGRCENQDGGYKCTCPPGWTGQNCEQDIDECTGKPCGHGRCVNQDGGYKCNCAPGWTGKNCQHDIDECVGKTCQHARRCVNVHGGYYCHCLSGWKGRNCEQDIDECATNPCRNRGRCVNQDGGYKCTCTPQDGLDRTVNMVQT